MGYQPSANISFTATGAELMLASQDYGTNIFNIAKQDIPTLLTALKSSELMCPVTVGEKHGGLRVYPDGSVHAGADLANPKRWGYMGFLTPTVRVRLVRELEKHIRAEATAALVGGVR